MLENKNPSNMSLQKYIMDIVLLIDFYWWVFPIYFLLNGIPHLFSSEWHSPIVTSRIDDPKLSNRTPEIFGAIFK